MDNGSDDEKWEDFFGEFEVFSVQRSIKCWIYTSTHRLGRTSRENVKTMMHNRLRLLAYAISDRKSLSRCDSLSGWVRTFSSYNTVAKLTSRASSDTKMIMFCSCSYFCLFVTLKVIYKLKIHKRRNMKKSDERMKRKRRARMNGEGLIGERATRESRPGWCWLLEMVLKEYHRIKICIHSAQSP